MHNNKQTGQCLKKIRELWCEWDPIGVTVDPNWPQDEYDNYLEPTLHLLESGASNQEIVEYLAYVVGEHMGLGRKGIDYSNPYLFAEKLRDWFDSKNSIQG